MDLTTIGGVILAAVAILGGQALEGGSIHSIMQPTAAIIVFGGTIACVVVQFPGHILKHALGEMKGAIIVQKHDVQSLVKSIVSLANKARRDGLVSIEKEIAGLPDPFLRRGLELAVDGTEAKQLRDVLETELNGMAEQGEHVAKVFEAAGGYAPTVGIIGAVLGLIHVMENLSDSSKLGSGIAVAFVATVYGVASANILFLPLAGKMKMRHAEEMVRHELVVEGVCSLAEGDNPRFIERKLSAYIRERAAGHGPAAAGAAATATAGA